MSNPWLDIPESDYVSHMSHPAVGQRPVLNRLLREALTDVKPRTLLVVGCSTGNGLEHVSPEITERVTVVDINPSYLRRLTDQFSSPGFELEIRCADVTQALLEADAFELIHAALVLEYVDWRPLIRRLAAALTRGGVLSVVLQLPSSETPAVTPTPFTTLQSLESLFHFVESDALIEAAEIAGLALLVRRTDVLPSGKAFEVLRLKKRAS